MRKTFAILEEQGVHTMTIVTSLYHQKRSQALYGVMARVYRRERNYDIRSAGNFCFDITEASISTPDHRLAIQGMVELLHLPKGSLPFPESPDEESGSPDGALPSE